MKPIPRRRATRADGDPWFTPVWVIPAAVAVGVALAAWFGGVGTAAT